MRPSLGRIVIYRSKIDNGPGNDVLSPAMVIRTQDTTVPAVIDRWGPEPITNPDGTQPAPRPDALIAELDHPHTVDLVVFGLGKTYREYSVVHGSERGQWEWPELVQ
jgi:hypothetical protein